MDKLSQQPGARFVEKERNPHAVRYLVTLENRIIFGVDCEQDQIAGAVKPVMVARVFRTAMSGSKWVELRGEQSGLWRFAAATAREAAQLAADALAEAYSSKVVSVTPDQPRV